ncbi:MAG: tRNA (N(6)-L-threonylcarbamoyladenosine(37)-C(2))-methylthiotransferase MtaB, partial [Sphingomonas sp.]|nr:tRNA (N(6)-L-threonylcarbamoyladenosine(37)-C(2))-methylthiotransferase MtaB [Sphingomonas sp.]
LVGTSQRVLLESPGKGHSDGFAPVLVEGAGRGEIRNARIVARDDDHLVGSAV